MPVKQDIEFENFLDAITYSWYNNNLLVMSWSREILNGKNFET